MYVSAGTIRTGSRVVGVSNKSNVCVYTYSLTCEFVCMCIYVSACMRLSLFLFLFAVAFGISIIFAAIHCISCIAYIDMPFCSYTYPFTLGQHCIHHIKYVCIRVHRLENT